MKGYVYILKCSDGKFYTGSTVNLEKRLWEHQNGFGANFTKKSLPVELMYVEEFSEIEKAYMREKQIQGWSHKKKVALIERNFEKVHEFAKCKNETSSKNMSPSTTSFDFAQLKAQGTPSTTSFDSAQLKAQGTPSTTSFDSAQLKAQGTLSTGKAGSEQ